jgi:hypothetical protein
MFAAFVAVAGCSRNSEDQAPKTVYDYFTIKIGDKAVRLQFAVHPVEQQQGLMQRRDLGTNDGMIFVYEKPQSMSYWMRNTPTPLDIGFFDAEGTLLEIYPLLPFDETPVKSRTDRLKFAVEMNQGWFRDNGVRPGAKLDIPAVAEAMKARGFKPTDYGFRP